MNKQRYGLSVVTYTYNDHDLVAGLLASMADWDFLPKEVIVVDDGSDAPFVLPDGAPSARVLRLDANQGPAMAKIAGLKAGGGRFLLSLDADIRLPPDWATRCLPVAAAPEVGLVATPILDDAGLGLLADYQCLRFSLQLAGPESPKVLPAGLWLMRREVWRKFGFGEYRQRLHEDVYFSGKLRRVGLALRLLPEPVARQVRRLSRRTMVRRGWTWQGGEYLEAAARDETGAVNAFLVAMRVRILRHQVADRRFAYYDYLYLAHALDGLLRAAGRPESQRRGLAALLAEALPGRELGAVFGADMAALGCPPLAAPSDSFLEAVAAGARSVLPEAFAAAVTDALPHLLAEDDRRDWHFSFYDAAPEAR